MRKELTPEQKARKIEYQREWRKSHHQEYRAMAVIYNRQYSQSHKAEKSESDRRYYQKHKTEIAEQHKKYCENCKTKRAIYQKQYRENHKTNRSTYRRKRFSDDINYKLKVVIGNEIRRSVSGTKQYEHSIDLLGCSIDDFRKHIERQFQPGMTWENWGYRGWHIDHIIPVASFDFTDPEQQKRASHYTNLQPLWAEDNFKKSNKILEIQLILM